MITMFSKCRPDLVHEGCERRLVTASREIYDVLCSGPIGKRIQFVEGDIQRASPRKRSIQKRRDLAGVSYLHFVLDERSGNMKTALPSFRYCS